MAVQLFRSRFIKFFPNVRTIMTSNFDFNKAKSELENNPYYQKYAEKIQQIQKEKPEEFFEKLKECEKGKQTAQTAEVKKVIYGEKKAPTTTQTKKPKALDEIMKISLLEDKSKEDIISIWTGFHKSKECVYGTIDNNLYKTFQEQGLKYPTFLLPLPRDGGYEFILLQFERNEVHFTPLLSFQTHKADAPECLTLVYYSEFADTKDIVLMKGEFDKNILSPLEAQCLVNTLHLYYGEKDEKRLNLMETFTNCPDDFSYMDLIAEIDRIPLKG